VSGGVRRKIFQQQKFAFEVCSRGRSRDKKCAKIRVDMRARRRLRRARSALPTGISSPRGKNATASARASACGGFFPFGTRARRLTTHVTAFSLAREIRFFFVVL